MERDAFSLSDLYFGFALFFAAGLLAAGDGFFNAKEEEDKSVGSEDDLTKGNFEDSVSTADDDDAELIGPDIRSEEDDDEEGGGEGDDPSAS